MSNISERVLSNKNEDTELDQNRSCVTQDHYLTLHKKNSSEIYVPCVRADDNTKYSDQFSKKTIRARFWKSDPSDIIHG